MLRASRLGCLVSLLLACASTDEQSEVTRNDVPSTAAATASNGPAATSELITIEKQTQATIGDSLRIGAAAFWEEEYTGADGKPRRGLTAGLWIYQKGEAARDQSVRVHPGQVMTAGAWRIEVMSIDEQSVEIAVKKTGG